MNKAEFLNELKKQISEYPVEETQKSMEYYAEMIDDRVEDGMTEAEAVASLGAVDSIANQIKCELPITTLVKQRAKEQAKGKKMPVWAIILLILGFPLWGGIVVFILGMILVFYSMIWVVDVVLWSAVVSFGAGALSGMIGFFVSLFRMSLGSAVFYLGGGLLCGGLGIFVFLGTLLITKGILYGTKRCFLWIKQGIVGKEK
ncbi:MAG: DUF1700 domain-containing protein [Bacteroides sp.]|nr:DUF1700 domain-containing protein [Bacteroides sp.]MCM1548765.1 DUF1700 domain-containing protein [Clostridium sp.]